MNNIIERAIYDDIGAYFKEDDLARNLYYTVSLPNDLVECRLKFKSKIKVAGLPYFVAAFNYLSHQVLDYDLFLKEEGTLKANGDEIIFHLPFSVALTGERIALNLLQHASSIATFVEKFVVKAEFLNIKILDTRKTLPGMRLIEKYAVRIGGGFNHRLGQTDLWMIKDNHKEFFGGMKNALSFFYSMQSFYNPIVVEIHSLTELEEAISLNVKHVMLDNFSVVDVQKAVAIKPDNMTYECSGGVRLDSIEKYLIPGVDAISVGALTYAAPPVDISLKYKKV